MLSVASNLVEKKVVTVVAIRCAVVSDFALMQKFIKIAVQGVRSTHGLCHSFRADILLATWTRGGVLSIAIPFEVVVMPMKTSMSLQGNTSIFSPL